MKSNNPVLWVSVLAIAVLPANLRGDDQGTAPADGESYMQLLEAESNLRMHELEVASSNFAIEEAEVDVAKAQANLNSVQSRARSEKEDARAEIEYSSLEVKQAEIRVEMMRLESEMKRAQLKLAGARYEYLKKALIGNEKKPETKKREQNQKPKPIPVRFEIVDDVDVIVVRGPKVGVEKLKALIGRLEKSDR